MKQELVGAYSGVKPFGKEPVIRKVALPRRISDKIDQLAEEQGKDPVVITYDLIAQELNKPTGKTPSRKSHRKS